MNFEELELRMNQFIHLKKMKKTQERVHVLKIICEAAVTCSRKSEPFHFSAKDIAEMAGKVELMISDSTIYRCFAFFSQIGLIRFSFKRKGHTFYEMNSFDSHSHLVCIKCNKVVELTCTQVDEIVQEICTKYEFKELDHQYTISGICKDCRQFVTLNRKI